MDTRRISNGIKQGESQKSKEELLDLLMTGWSNEGDDKRLESIKSVLEKQVIMDSRTARENGVTLLHLMAMDNMLKIIKYLVSEGVNINVPDNDGNTALHYAAKAGHCDVILLLYYLGININLQNKHGNTALHVAVKEFQLKSIETLLTLDHPIDRSIKNNNQYTAKMLIPLSENQTRMVKLADVFLNKKNIYSSTRLHLAVINNNIDEVEKLLNCGASIDVQDRFGNTPLHYAAQNGHMDIFKLLYSTVSANTVMTNYYGDTVLHFAAQSGSLEMIKMLCIKKSVNINATNKNGETALHALVNSKNPDPACVKYLMTTNINTLKEDSKGNTVKDLVNQIKDLNVRKQLNFALSNVESATTSTKNIRINIQDDFKSLKDELPYLNLRNPQIQNNNMAYLKKLASSLDTMKDVEATIIKSNELIPPPTREDFDKRNLKHIGAYLASGGDPNLVITDDQQPMIIYALRNHLFTESMELLRYGAKLNDDDVTRLDIENNPHIKETLHWVLNELSCRYVKNIQILSDANLERENKIFMKRLKTLFLNPDEVQFTEPKKRDSKLSLLKLPEIKEFKKLSQTKEGMERIKLVTKICSTNLVSNVPGSKNVIFNKEELHKTKIDILALISLYTPNDILKSLLKLMPHFTKTQHFMSLLLIKDLIMYASRKFGHDLIKDNYFINSYLQQAINDNITVSLKNIYFYILNFEKNPTRLNYLNLDKIMSKYPIQYKFNIVDLIDDAANHKKNISISAKRIANDMVTLTARFYHSLPLKKLKHIDKEKKYANNQYKYFTHLLTSFIQYSILRQDTPKKRARVAALFVQVADECLGDPRIPDLNTAACINTALNSECISRLKIKLNKPYSLTQESLKMLFSTNRTFALYTKFQSTYVNVLPWMYLVNNRLTALKLCKVTAEQMQPQGEFYKQFISLCNNVVFYGLSYTTDLAIQISKTASLRESQLDELSLLAQPPQFPDLSSSKCTYKDFTAALNKQIVNKYPLTIIYGGNEYRGNEALNYIFRFLNEKSGLMADEIIKIYNSYKLYDQEYDSASSLLATSSESDVKHMRSSNSDGSKPNSSRFFNLTRKSTATIAGSTMSGSLPPSPKEQVSQKEITVKNEPSSASIRPN